MMMWTESVPPEALWGRQSMPRHKPRPEGKEQTYRELTRHVTRDHQESRKWKRLQKNAPRRL